MLSLLIGMVIVGVLGFVCLLGWPIGFSIIARKRDFSVPLLVWIGVAFGPALGIVGVALSWRLWA